MLVTKVLAKLEPGGAQLSVLRVCRGLAARGHRVRLLVGHATEAGEALAFAHGVVPELMGARDDLQWRCDEAFAAWLQPRLAGADVVHGHMLGAWWAVGRVVDEATPFAASEHNDLLWPGEPQDDHMAEVAGRVDRFYAHSPGAWAAVAAAGVRAERIVLGTSPVGGFGAVEREGLPRPRIVFTGRLMPDKGPDVLVEAVARMDGPPRVLVLGAGLLEPLLRERIAALGLQDVVTLEGWVAEPGPWVAGAAVQACPSRDEAFSQAAVLAMALGVPVVGTRVDGFPATLAEGRGRMVEAEDPDALAAALADALAAPVAADLRAARAWAQRFTVARVTATYERDYAMLAERVAA